MHGLLGIGSAVVAVGLSGAFCSAAVIYSANGFESPTFATGALTGQDGWSQGAGSSAIIETTTVHAGNQAVQLQNVGDREIARYKDFSAPENQWVDVWVLPPSNDQIQVNPAVNLRDSKGIEASVAFNGAKGTIANTSVAYNVGQWNRVTIFVDGTNDNWDAYLNGTEILSNQPFLLSTHTNPISINTYDIDWTAKAGSTGTGFFADDFQITDSNPLSVPEPATMSLAAGIGGLALIRRRRR